MPHIPYQPRPVPGQTLLRQKTAQPAKKPPTATVRAPMVSQPASQDFLSLPDVPDLPFDEDPPPRPNKPQVGHANPRMRTYAAKTPGLETISIRKHQVDPAAIAKSLGIE